MEREYILTVREITQAAWNYLVATRTLDIPAGQCDVWLEIEGQGDNLIARVHVIRRGKNERGRAFCKRFPHPDSPAPFGE